MRLEKLFENFRGFANEEVLIESRLSDAKKKFPEIADKIDILSKNDPSGKNKYLMWMSKQLNDSKDLEGVIDATKLFHRNASKLGDINKISSYKDVEDLVLRSQIQKKWKNVKKVEGADVLYNDDNFMLVRTVSKKASCFYGKGTSWCVSNPDAKYFEQYSRKGAMFFILINKNLHEKKDLGQRINIVVFGIKGENFEELYGNLRRTYPGANLFKLSENNAIQFFDLKNDHNGVDQRLVLEYIADNLYVVNSDDFYTKTFDNFMELIEKSVKEKTVDPEEFGYASEDLEERLEEISDRANDSYRYSSFGYEFRYDEDEQELEDYSAWGETEYDFDIENGDLYDWEAFEDDYDLRRKFEREIEYWIEENNNISGRVYAEISYSEPSFEIKIVWDFNEDYYYSFKDEVEEDIENIINAQEAFAENIGDVDRVISGWEQELKNYIDEENLIPLKSEYGYSEEY